MSSKNGSAIIPDFLCIGLLCHDVYEDGFILGGTASYASLLASKLGQQTAVLTRVGADFQFFDLFSKADIQICNRPSPKTTIFDNQYHDGKRTQYIYHPPKQLSLTDLPATWANAPIVKFCLIANELDTSLFHAFPHALKGATIQGWLRSWDDSGLVSTKAMDWSLLQSVDVVFLSDADVAAYENAISEMIKWVKVLVVTRGKDGATVFFDGQSSDYPAYPTTEVDPTGAGDIFATAFLWQYYETRDIARAAAYAHAAASFVVEGYGIRVPEVEEILGRFADYQKRFF